MLKIYLGDLVYDTVPTNYVVPLNISYLAAYINKQFPGEIDVQIFKYPKKLEEAIKSSPPDVLGLSNYSWNVRLNQLFISMVKRLNPHVVTVLGGPHIRVDTAGIKDFLQQHPLLDFYCLFEGEEAFSSLIQSILGGNVLFPPPPGIARLSEGNLDYTPAKRLNVGDEIELPSPYLTGVLDPFLANLKMTPLLETTRGCPFKCAYCTWGIAAHSKVRRRPLQVVFEEMDYISNKSVGQVNWIFCDANFGILPRDIEIAVKMREIMDKKGVPNTVTLWHSKNTSERNIEIAKILNDRAGYIAIQSTDPVVLGNIGRGNFKDSHLREQISYYHKKGLGVSTDILIGLPGETASSHENTLFDAFEMGFSIIQAYNIRMLPGSKYETDAYRQRFGVQTKYRPIFGAYGEYDGKRIFELEESVRATKDMSEAELEDFKIFHWLIYLAWNEGLFKPILYFGQRMGVNPGWVLKELIRTKNPLLVNEFHAMQTESRNEWFETPAAMIEFYDQQENSDKMINQFVKLNFHWIAAAYQKDGVLAALKKELLSILNEKIIQEVEDCSSALEGLQDLDGLMDHLVCKDLLKDSFCLRQKYNRMLLENALGLSNLPQDKTVEIEIYRTQQDVDFCKFHLMPNGKSNFSKQNFARFLEVGGSNLLTNRVRIAKQN